MPSKIIRFSLTNDKFDVKTYCRPQTAQNPLTVLCASPKCEEWFIVRDNISNPFVELAIRLQTQCRDT
jgi:hypothetical protein